MKIKIKRLSTTAILPTRGSDQAAGYDLYADAKMKIPGMQNLMIPPHTSTLIPTGISIEVPDGYFGAIYARSGLASKQGLRPANCVGVIDSDYRGEVLVALRNDTNQPQMIEWNERVAQLIIQKYEHIEFEEVSDLTDTARGEGGFGSTGTTDIRPSHPLRDKVTKEELCSIVSQNP